VARQQAPKWEPTAFGNLVRDWRLSRHLSQVEMAVALSISDTYLSQIERGRIPDLKAPDFFETWTRVLGLGKEELVARGELWRYNPVQPSNKELSPGQRIIVAVTDGLDDETVMTIARGVLAMYGGRLPELPPSSDAQE